MKSLGPILGVLIICGALCGCGYYLSGTSGRASVIPEHVKTIAVLPFENRTTRSEIEQRVTEEVASLLTRRGNYSVITKGEDADAELSGVVSSYTTSPVQFDGEGRATRVEVVVSIEGVLRDTKSDEILWSQSGLVFREQYAYPSEGEFFDEESVALDELAQGAAATLVTSILEGF